MSVTWLWGNSISFSLGRGLNWTLWMRFYLMFKFDVSSFSMNWNIKIFRLVILLTLSSSKLIVILLLWENQNWLYLFILVTLGRSRPSQIACMVTTMHVACIQTVLHIHKSSCPILIENTIENYLLPAHTDYYGLRK